ncbi:MAG: hypothetical protein MUQ30_18065 [Anaerolineae bacterium]|nr:hypothetical protein [Anaerolineae bacterium]
MAPPGSDETIRAPSSGAPQDGAGLSSGELRLGTAGSQSGSAGGGFLLYPMTFSFLIAWLA